MNVGVHTTTPRSIPCIVYNWNILDVTINSVVAATHKNYRLSTFTAIWCTYQCLLETTARAAICRDYGVVKSLRACCGDWTPGCRCEQPQFTTSVSRRFIRLQWNEYENSRKLLYRSHPTNASANLRFCPCVGLRCNWMTRALHFQRADIRFKRNIQRNKIGSIDECTLDYNQTVWLNFSW